MAEKLVERWKYLAHGMFALLRLVCNPAALPSPLRFDAASRLCSLRVILTYLD